MLVVIIYAILFIIISAVIVPRVIYKRIKDKFLEDPDLCLTRLEKFMPNWRNELERQTRLVAETTIDNIAFRRLALRRGYIKPDAKINPAQTIYDELFYQITNASSKEFRAKYDDCAKDFDNFLDKLNKIEDEEMSSLEKELKEK